MNPDDDINSNDVNQVNDPDLPETGQDQPGQEDNSMQAAGRSGSGNRRSSRSGSHRGSNASGAAVDKEAQRRGGQHSHGGR